MTAVVGTAELDAFQRAIAGRFGLRFDDNRSSQLAEVLGRRIEARGMTAPAYLEELAGGAAVQAELSALARELTVGETYFFRHSEQFAALSEVALPERLSARAATRSLRLLSAGCASGEEAYSLAILVREAGIEPGFSVTIQGVDLNPDALARAARGVYTPWSMRETPAATRQRWFSAQGRELQLSRTIREAVRFDQHNLIQQAPQLLPERSFDIIFCRNVLMYFTTEHATAIVAQLARALAPGGFLFLGHAETLRGLSHAFHLRSAHNAFYYQLRETDEAYEPPQAFDYVTPTAPRGAPTAPLTSQSWVAPWLDAVERSSDRIRALSTGGAPVPAASPEPVAAPVATRQDLSEPLELLQSERFSAALQVLSELPAAQSREPTTLLLQAALLTHQGAFGEAEQVCHDLLRRDDLNAGAHYLLALCLEARGDQGAAVEHDRIAIYLDAGFAMPHLHLGLMARRRRDGATARAELGQALHLLEGEEPARLLLFGGGFGRSALQALCRSELGNLAGVT